MSQIHKDSSEAFGGLRSQVPGAIGDRFYIELALLDTTGAILSSNEYLLLVGDQEKELAKIKAIGAEAMEVKQQYGWANYYRYFKGLGGEDGVPEADEVVPRVRGFGQTTSNPSKFGHEQ